VSTVKSGKDWAGVATAVVLLVVLPMLGINLPIIGGLTGAKKKSGS